LCETLHIDCHTKVIKKTRNCVRSSLATLRVGVGGGSWHDCRVIDREPITMPQNPAKNLSLIAAIDLGSNSFHMVVAKAHHNDIRILERLGEKVQLAAGIDEERQLSEESMQRGLDCLKRFAQLINGMPDGAVRIVGTNALREARNRGEFIRRAEAIPTPSPTPRASAWWPTSAAAVPNSSSASASSPCCAKACRWAA
jgi:hypothetical protein